MSRIMNVGLRPLRVGKFSTLVRPKNLLLLGGHKLSSSPV